MQSLDAATAIDRSCRPTPIWGARQPLPKTARYRLVFLRRPVVPRWNGARGPRTPYLVRADGAQNDLDSTRRPGDSCQQPTDRLRRKAIPRTLTSGEDAPIGFAFVYVSPRRRSRLGTSRVSGAGRGARSPSGSAPRRPER